jgi:hypothetical protein
MPNTYPLNQNPIPQVTMTPEQHHRFINVSIVVVAIVIIFGVLYWWTTTGKTKNNTGPSQSDLRAEVAAILRSSPVQVSQEEIDSVASKLSTSKVTVTDAQRQAVANALRSN